MKSKLTLSRMKNLTQAAIILAGMVPAMAHSYIINDLSNRTGSYWGGNAHGYGDVIGDSTYNVDRAEVTLANDMLGIRIYTNFAGHAGADAWAGPNGIGYGDVFLASAWNPFGSDLHHIYDNASNGTHWTFGLSLDNRWSNTGGTFKLYELNGSTNLDNIRLSEELLTCAIGSQCYYRDGQATAVDTGSATVVDTGLTGHWTVTPGSMIEFSLNISGTGLASYEDIAFHWGETCQNDVIEGFGAVNVSEPSILPLLGLGLLGFSAIRVRRGSGSFQWLGKKAAQG